MSIIEEEVREFIRRLPDLKMNPPTAHIIMLVIRSRYSKEFTGIKVKDIVTERKIIRPTTEYTQEWRENYLNKIYNLASLQEHGRYIVKDTLMPSKSMGMLACVTPRNTVTANVDMMKYMAEQLSTSAQGLSRVDVEFFSRLHSRKDPENRGIITIDVDNAELYKSVYDELSPYKKWMITRTGRGYHFILDLRGGDKNMMADFFRAKGTWDTMFNKYKGEVEMQRDSQEPVPGTFYYSPLRENNHVAIME